MLLGRGGSGTVWLFPCPRWGVAVKRVITLAFIRILLNVLVLSVNIHRFVFVGRVDFANIQSKSCCLANQLLVQTLQKKQPARSEKVQHIWSRRNTTYSHASNSLLLLLVYVANSLKW